jgi:hypothetical protein
VSLLRAAFGLAGLAVMLAALTTFVRRRTRRFVALAWIAAGGGVAVLAARPEITAIAGPASYVLRMRMVLGFLTLLVLLVTLEAVRRFAMQERYALLWIGTALVIFLFTVYPDAVAWLVALTGMHYVSAVVVVIFAFLVLVAFHFSLTLSEFREDQKRIAQRTGLLELRLSELEQAVKRERTPAAREEGER